MTAATPSGIGIDAQNPWPGLSAFDEAARDFFAGRDAESAELLRLVGQAPLTVLFGKSGLGKTSLLQAGLFPLLRKQDFLPVYVRLDMRDRSAPLIWQAVAALRAEIVGQEVDVSAPEFSDSLWEQLHGLGVQWWSRRNRPLVPLFVFDQFEEAFTVGAENPEGVDRLRLDLADLVENRIPDELLRRIESGAATDHLDLRDQPYKIMLSFREDFLPEVEGWKADVPSLTRNRLRLLPMSAEQALQVVSGTTPSGPIHTLVGEDVAREIVRFVAVAQTADPTTSLRRARVTATPWDKLEIEPALLSLVCAGLNEKRKTSGQSTIDAGLLKQTGGAIIQSFYQRCVADVPDKTRRFVEDTLITEGGFRNSYPLQDALEQGQLTEPLLRQLVDCRLLRIDHQLGVDRVELIHDLLTGVVREHRNRERERVRARRQRRLWAAAGLVFVFLSAIGLLLFTKWQQAHENLVQALILQWEAEAGQLAMRSRALVDRQTPGAADAGLLLAAAAHGRRATELTYGALQYALDALPQGLTRIIVLPAPVAALSPDGQTAAVRSGGRLRLWDAGNGVARGGLLPGIVQGDDVKSVAFSTDGRLLAASTRTGSLVVWEVATGQQRSAPMSEKGNTARAVALSPDGKTLASGHSHGVIRLWDIASGRRHELPFAGHRLDIVSLAFSRDGKILASGSLDEVRLWTVATGEQRGAPLTGHQDEVEFIAFSPDGKTLASGSRDGVLLTSLADPDAPAMPLAIDKYSLSSMIFSHDGRWLATGGADELVRLWDVTTRQPHDNPLLGSGGEVTALAFSADDKSLVTGSEDRALRMWELASAESRHVLIQGKSLDIRHAALSPHGRTLASGGADGSIRLWDAATGQLTATLQGNAGEVASLVFSPDGTLLASGWYDGSLRIWDVGSAEPRAVLLRGHEDPVTSLAFSPDNTLLASGGYIGTLRLWDVTSGQPRGGPLEGHKKAVTAVAFSPNGKTLASGSEDMAVRLWDVATGQPRGGPRTGHTASITTIAFNPLDDTLVGPVLVSGSADGMLCFFLVEREKEKPDCRPVRAHRRAVTGLVFSPISGLTYVSASADGTLRFWDSDGLGQPLGEPLRLGNAEARGVAFVDRQTLVSFDSGNRLRRWDTPDAWIDRVCAKVARNLSRTEWDEFFRPMSYTTQCAGLPPPSN